MARIKRQKSSGIDAALDFGRLCIVDGRDGRVYPDVHGAGIAAVLILCGLHHKIIVRPVM